MQKTLKRLLCTIQTVLLLVLPLAAQATSGTCGDALTWTLSSAGTLTISGTGNMWDYEAGSAPWGTGINKVIIEAGVTSIGDYAFYNCSRLTSAEVSNYVKTAGESSFKGCTSLKTMTLLISKEQQTSGDANGDGVVDLMDALLMLKHSAGWNVLINETSIDVNADGKQDLQDVLTILHYAAGWDVTGLSTDMTALIRLLMSYITPCTHTSRTERVDATAASIEQEGCTGDLYCLECGELIEKGAVLPKLIEMPKTGDSSQPLVWLAALVLSGGAFLLLQQSRKFKQQYER